ncbi:LacI family DNA-binding transcriptional regulator [Persicirhabdus sediminis]|uniref:LacI family DNA-binding transcriptional regulator n=1 Tax=Persicirhabdus sediminis TaxID=454144 RepID=A0A8J7MFE8_9BACT|nr:LacI family DNA-binding transcriptional regulator [Persicirhabdus sediminis]MBK1792257.1 LacI family DNA-binding transcriptional regulator [Persicirhabdus sediminis]
MKGKRISLADIANELGVSKTTVSFVLNGHAETKKISKKTQERVEALVAKYNYRPNAVARNLRLGSTKVIGLIVPDISNPYYAKIARMLEDQASDKGYHVIFGSSSESIERERSILAKFRQQSVDGILLASADVNSPHIEELAGSGLPVVLFDRIASSSEVKLSSIGVDNKSAMRQVTKRLLANGSKRIAMVCNHIGQLATDSRVEGYQEAMNDANIQMESNWLQEVNESAGKSMDTIMAELLNAKQPVDAVVFSNSLLAQDGLKSIHQNHAEQIANLQLGCFDKLDLFDYVTPKVVYAEQPNEAIVRSAFETLLAQLPGQAKQQKEPAACTKVLHEVKVAV